MGVTSSPATAVPAWKGIPTDRVVAVIAKLANGKYQIGSGFLVGPDRVLTAEHCAKDKLTGAPAAGLEVVRKSDGTTIEVKSRLACKRLDLAVLDLTERFPLDSAAPVDFGRVNRGYAEDLGGCQAIGYPLFQFEPSSGQRNSAQLSGVIRTSDESETGRLLLRDAILFGVALPESTNSTADASPWGGLSGALVFHRGLALGVIIEHHPRQGPASGVISAVDTLAGSDHPDARAVAEALGLAGVDSTQLPLAQPEPPTPLPTVPSRPHQLPIEDVELVGREQEFEEASGLLSSPQDGRPSIVVVSGMPAVGKSAVVLSIAHRVAHSYPDGQLFVRLRGADKRALDPSRVLADFLRALGVGETAIPESLEERAEMYRSRLWDQRVLVVLDDARSEDQVRPLLPGAPTCGVLLSARQALPGVGGHQVSLEELTPEAAVEILRQHVGDQRMNAESAAAVDIARECGYLPLALMIAGARLAIRPSMRLATFAQKLERRRLDELKSGNSEVRAALLEAFEALDEPTQDAFRWLGVLEGPDFTAWRLAALLDSDEDVAEELIESLLQSLVITADRSGDGLWERFRMHDLMKLCARELLEQKATEEVRAEALRRVNRSFLFLANRAASALEPGEDFGWLETTLLRSVDDPVLLDSIGSAPLTWFSVERQTLVIAIERLTTLEAPGLVIGLTRSMTTFFDYHAHWDDWSIVVDMALASARAGQDSDAEAALLRSDARRHRYRGELNLARAMLEQSLVLARGASNGHAVAESLIDSIRLDWYQGRHEDAHIAYNEATTWFTSADDNYGLARCWASIALVLRDQGDVDDAVCRCEDALEIFRDVGDQRWVAATLTTLADLLLDENRPQDAEKCVSEALPLLRALGFRWWEAVLLRTLGLIHAELGRLLEAEQCLTSVVSALKELNLEWWESVARVSLADVLGRSGRHAEALDTLRPAEAAFEQRSDRRWSAIIMVLRARLIGQHGGTVPVDELRKAVGVLAGSRERTWRTIGEGILDDLGGAGNHSG